MTVRPRRRHRQQQHVDVQQHRTTQPTPAPLTHRGTPLCVRGINSAAVLRITLTPL